MPRFHLNLYNRAGASRDEEGLELPDLDSARAAAIDGIRSLASEEVRRGRLDLAGRVEILDEAGTLLATIAFAEAVEILPSEDER